MNPGEFRFFADLIKKRSGITLTDDKEYLVESRLMPLARSKQLTTLSELCAKLRANPTEEWLVEITEAMTTNESSFFRDIKPYELLRKLVLPKIIAANNSKQMRIWSAACSTGQEPYSISMTLKGEAANLPGWKFDILATDLAKKVVDKAESGIYSQFEAQRGLPIQMLIKYFDSLPNTTWQLKNNIRDMVKFQTQNLLEDYSRHGKFDIIFVRNVLIYFEDGTKAQITAKMARSLQPHGVLILGSTENLIDPTGLFAPLPDFRGAYTLK